MDTVAQKISVRDSRFGGSGKGLQYYCLICHSPAFAPVPFLAASRIPAYQGAKILGRRFAQKCAGNHILLCKFCAELFQGRDDDTPSWVLLPDEATLKTVRDSLLAICISGIQISSVDEQFSRGQLLTYRVYTFRDDFLGFSLWLQRFGNERLSGANPIAALLRAIPLVEQLWVKPFTEFSWVNAPRGILQLIKDIKVEFQMLLEVGDTELPAGISLADLRRPVLSTNGKVTNHCRPGSQASQKSMTKSPDSLRGSLEVDGDSTLGQDHVEAQNKSSHVLQAIQQLDITSASVGGLIGEDGGETPTHNHARDSPRKDCSCGENENKITPQKHKRDPFAGLVNFRKDFTSTAAALKKDPQHTIEASVKGVLPPPGDSEGGNDRES